MSEVPELADALPGAERALRRAAQRTAAPERAAAVAADLVAVLEAAGGPDVGNAVRTHLERLGGVPDELPGPEEGQAALLEAALWLHDAASQDVRRALARAGLPGGLSRAGPRSERDAFAVRALTARDRAVRAVLERLGRRG